MKTLRFMNLWRAVAALTLFSGVLVQPARSATCVSADLASTDPTAYIATPPNLVTVLDITTSAQCTIAVGTTANSGPNNIAVTPDGTKLFVENDTEASISVVDLGLGTVTNVSLSGVTAPMTANLAVSPDTSNPIVYLVVLSSGATNPTFFTVGTATPFTVTPATGFNSSSSLVAAGDSRMGIAFSPDGTAAYVTTQGATYVVTGGTTPGISATVATTGGSVAVSPDGTFAYVVNLVANPTTVSKVTIPGNAVSAVSPALTCTGAAAVAITPDSSAAYFTCPGNSSVTKIDTATNTVAATITYTTLPTPVPAPNQMAVTSDGASVYTTGSTGALSLVSVANNTVSASVSTGTAPVGGIAFRPVQLSIAPTTPSVPTGKSLLFASTLKYAFRNTLTWAVNGTTGGNTTTGTITTSGFYTAPNTIPGTNPVTVSASSAEIPVGSLLYPSQAASTTVSITPSQLVFTVQPVSGGSVNNTMAEVDVSVEDAAGNVVTANTDTITMAISSPGAFSGGSTISVAAVAGVAKFTNLVPTVAGSSFTLTADDATLSLSSQPSAAFAVASGAPTKLAFTNAPLTLTSNVCSAALTVQAQDAGGIGSNVASNESLALTTSSGGGHFFSDSACGTGITSIIIPANSDAVTFYYKDPKSGSQTLTATGTGAFAAVATQTESVASGPAAYFVITGSATQTAGTSQTITITANDASGNVATTYTGTHTLTFSGASNSTNPVTHPTVTDNTATARTFGTNTVVTFTSGVSTAGGSMVLYQAESATVAASDGTIGTSSVGGLPLPVAVTTAAAAKFILTGAATQTAGASQPLTLTAQDAFGNVATGYTAAHNITFSGAASSTNPVTAPTVTDNTATARTFGTSTALTFSAGASTTGGSMTLYAAGTSTIAATDGTVSTSSPNGQSLGVTVTAGAAAKLVITGSGTQTAGTSQTLAITAQDAYGNTAVSYAGSKNLTFSGANLSPNNNAPTVTGVAFGTADPITFTGGIAAPGAILYKAESAAVAATDGTISTASPNGMALAVTVNPAAPASLTFSTQPVNAPLSGVGGTAFGPPAAVTLKDAFGNIATNSSAAVSLSSTYGSTPANAAAKVGGTTSVPASSGVATFSNLQFPIAGIYTLTASSAGVPNVTSTSFTLTSTVTVATPTIAATGPLTIRVSSTSGSTSTQNDPNKVPLDVTWNMTCAGTTVSTTVTNGTATSACGTITAGPSGSFSATYTAPATAPSPATVTLTATSITDPAKSSAAATIALVGDSAAVSGVGSTAVNPVILSPSASSAGSTVNLLGPAPADGVTFAVSCGSVMLNNAATGLVSCQPAPSATSGTASGTTPVTVTLSGSFAAMLKPAPNGPQTPFSPGTKTGHTDWRIPALLLVLCLFGLTVIRTRGLTGYRLRRGLAFVFLLCLSAMWMTACTQFSVPSNPPPPVPPTPAGTGSAVITFTPAGAGPGGDNFQTVKATVYFVVQ